MLRRTKIVATMGPATDSLEVLTEMMRAGVDVARLNASHGTVADRRRRLALVREASQRADTTIDSRVRVGGELSDRKGVNRQGGGISAPAVSARDHEDIQFVAEEGVDYMAVSFARDAADMEQARALLRTAGGQARLVAKVERHEAVENLASIIEASDVVMVARGDLGVEMGYAELTGLQKTIIHETRTHNRVVITATQMMESMVQNPAPTRAEVSDVANAVMAGTG